MLLKFMCYFSRSKEVFNSFYVIHSTFNYLKLTGFSDILLSHQKSDLSRRYIIQTLTMLVGFVWTA